MFETAKINLRSALIVLIIATLPCKIISQKKQPIANSDYAFFDYNGKDDAYANVSKSENE
jgi:xylan 1,4-beta-xylosidase